MTKEELGAMLPEGAAEDCAERLYEAVLSEISAGIEAGMREESAAARGELARVTAELEAARGRAEAAEIDGALDRALLRRGARNLRAARALIDADAVRQSSDREKAAREAVEKLAAGEDARFLFEPAPTGRKEGIGGRVGDAPPPDGMARVRAAAGV